MIAIYDINPFNMNVRIIKCCMVNVKHTIILHISGSNARRQDTESSDEKLMTLSLDLASFYHY